MFIKKSGGWKDRISQFPARRTITEVESGTSTIVTVSRAEGTVTEEGDPFSADNMNDLETRIKTECDLLEKCLANQQQASTASTSFAVGNYLVWNGKFYKVIRAINTNDAFVEGSNIQATTVAEQLRSVISGLATTNGNITTLSNNTNNALNGVNSSITQVSNRVEYINNIRPFGKNISWTNFTMSNGYKEVTVDCSDILQNRAAAVTITAGQTGAVLGASLLDANRSAVRIAISNLSNPSFSGSIAEVNIIVWGR